MTDAMHEALKRVEAGDWAAAHRLVRDQPGPRAAWLHAHLHRIEGDAQNDAYWYRRAGRAPFDGTPEAERAAMRALA